MKNILLTLLSTCYLILSTTLSHAATYHVSPTGNDNNPGTNSSPFKTINKGVATMSPGDTLSVAAGTYPSFIVSKSGTSSAPLTINGSSAKINATTAFAILLSGSHIKVSGFETYNSESHSVLINGKNIEYSNFIVRDSVLENKENDKCRGTGGWGSGLKVAVGGENIYIHDGKIFHNCGEGFATTRGINVTVERVVAYDNFAVNFYLDNSKNVVLKNSLAYCTNDARFYRDGKKGVSVAIGEEDYDNWGAQLENIKVINNILVDCPGIKVYQAELSSGGLKGALIERNTIYNQVGASGIYIPSQSQNRDIVIRNNITGGSVSSGSGITASGNMTTTPFTHSTPTISNLTSFTPQNSSVGANPSLLQSSNTTTPTTKAGDLNGDGVVNLLDFNKLIAGFGNTYTILDFTSILNNYGN